MDSNTQIAIGLIWCDGKLVVGRRADNQVLGGHDEFPGGKCAVGEPAQEAVIRECREETGLVVEVVGLRLQIQHAYPHGQLMLHFFDCVAESVTLLKEPFAWRSVDDVLSLNFPAANRSVLDSIRQHPFPMSAS